MDPASNSPHVSGNASMSSALEAASDTPVEFESSKRLIETDKKISKDIETYRLVNRLFLRLVAKKIRFNKVDFSYCIFDTCYLRDCYFDSCTFVGCRFLASNFSGSRFDGCKFDYAIFERTNITSEILDTGCPATENLAAKFARTLRINFQQIGDAGATNKAIRVELNATGVHLKKAWNSKESYYRRKYRGIRRFQSFLEWTQFIFFDFVWGNGESIVKLLRTAVLFFIFMTGVDVWLDLSKSGVLVASYGHAIEMTPEVFWGVTSPVYYPHGYLAFVVLVRLVVIGMLLSILIKRLNRR